MRDPNSFKITASCIVNYWIADLNSSHISVCNLTDGRLLDFALRGNRLQLNSTGIRSTKRFRRKVQSYAEMLQN